MTPPPQDGKALWVWRRFKSGDGQEGLNCAVFRNEGAVLSSDLILAADAEKNAGIPVGQERAGQCGHIKGESQYLK